MYFFIFIASVIVVYGSVYAAVFFIIHHSLSEQQRSVKNILYSAASA